MIRDYLGPPSRVRCGVEKLHRNGSNRRKMVTPSEIHSRKGYDLASLVRSVEQHTGKNDGAAVLSLSASGKNRHVRYIYLLCSSARLRGIDLNPGEVDIRA